jgi:hypothetical protein
MAQGAEHALKALIEHQMEAIRFVARRTHGDLEFLRRLRHCAGWQEFIELQQSWLKDCVAEYGEEWGRLAGASCQIAANGMAPLESLMYRSATHGRTGDGAGG